MRMQNNKRKTFMGATNCAFFPKLQIRSVRIYVELPGVRLQKSKGKFMHLGCMVHPKFRTPVCYSGNHVEVVK